MTETATETDNLQVMSNLERIDDLQLEDYQELLSDLVTYLVDDPSGIEITTTLTPAKVIFTLLVPSDQKGKVIGKGGAIFKALQALFSALARKGPRRFVELELLDDDEHMPSTYYPSADDGIDIPPSPLLQTYTKQIEAQARGSYLVQNNITRDENRVPIHDLVKAHTPPQRKQSAGSKKNRGGNHK
jgi:predicted RNA-binding protein YlqC (UPF0109 family)